MNGASEVDRRPGFESREQLSGDWAAAVHHTGGQNPACFQATVGAPAGFILHQTTTAARLAAVFDPLQRRRTQSLL